MGSWRVFGCVLLAACGHSPESSMSAANGATGGSAASTNPNTSTGGVAAAGGAGRSTQSNTSGGSGGAMVPARTGGHGGAGNSAAANSGGAGAVSPSASAGASGAANAGTSSPAAGTHGDSGAGAPASAGLRATDTLIPDPSWDCKMASGLPPTEGATLVFEADLQLGDAMDLGATQYGQRKIFPIKGGSIKGAKFNGDFMNGGLDWQLTRDTGAIEIEQVALLRASNGETIYLRNCGLAPSANGETRIAPDFEASSGGNYAFLNTGKFVGRRELDPSGKSMKLFVYEAGAASATSVHMPAKTAALPSQAWACEQPKGSAGALVYTEQVAIGGGLSVGASKYGTRNAIPITGGTFSGQKLNGDVIPGGADFQLTATGSIDLQLDARYTLKTDDGELIAVRNCGGATATKLYFETRTSGKYAWLTQGEYTSSVALAIGGVAISIYEAK